MSATLPDIKRRIATTRQLKKVTGTLQKVASARLAKERRSIEGANRYFDSICQVLHKAHRALPPSANKHPMLKENTGKSICLVVFAADRGLCGGFNTHLMSEINTFLNDHYKHSVDILIRGKVVYRRATRRNLPRIRLVDDLEEINTIMTNGFLASEYGKVYVLYWKFISGVKQETVIEQLLPVPLDTDIFKKDSDESYADPGLMEPNPTAIIEKVLPEYVRMYAIRCATHSSASENAARQSSMSRATENAGEVHTDLMKTYSRLRQENITTEMLEIVGGMIGREKQQT